MNELTQMLTDIWQCCFFAGHIKTDYTEDDYCIGNYPLSAALACTKICSAFEEAWNVF